MALFRRIGILAIEIRREPSRAIRMARHGPRISQACYQFSRFLHPVLCLIVVLALASWLPGQTCSTGSDLDAATKGAIDSAASQYLQMSKNGDVAGLKANAIPQLAGDFSSIEQAVVTNKPYLAGGQATIAGTYLLDASQAKARRCLCELNSSLREFFKFLRTG